MPGDVTVIHQLTGYDKRTELVRYEVAVTPADLAYLRDVFEVDTADDPDVTAGVYELPEGRFDQIATYLNAVASPETCDWFLEAYDEPARVAG